MRCAIVLLLGLLAAGACQSSAYGPWPRRTPPGTQREYVCRQATRAPVLDGQLDDDVWAHAPWSEPFVDAVDPDGPRPPFETWTKMLWDTRHLYVAAVLMDDDVRATVERAGAHAWTDDDFELFIDPGTGGRAWLEVRVNARGVIEGFVVHVPGGTAEARRWPCPTLDGGLQVQGTLNDEAQTDRAWVVELAIPWSCLAASELIATHMDVAEGPVVGDEWRMDFLRRRRMTPDGPQAVWSWSPVWSTDPRQPAHWGRVRFAR